MSMILIFVHGMTEGRGLTSAATLTVAAPDPGSMWIVVLAQRKSHAELRVELGEFLHADELVLASRPGPYVERDAQLMV